MHTVPSRQHRVTPSHAFIAPPRQDELEGVSYITSPGGTRRPIRLAVTAVTAVTDGSSDGGSPTLDGQLDGRRLTELEAAASGLRDEDGGTAVVLGFGGKPQRLSCGGVTGSTLPEEDVFRRSVHEGRGVHEGRSVHEGEGSAAEGEGGLAPWGAESPSVSPAVARRGRRGSTIEGAAPPHRALRLSKVLQEDDHAPARPVRLHRRRHSIYKNNDKTPEASFKSGPSQLLDEPDDPEPPPARPRRCSCVGRRASLNTSFLCEVGRAQTRAATLAGRPTEEFSSLLSFPLFFFSSHRLTPCRGGLSARRGLVQSAGRPV